MKKSIIAAAFVLLLAACEGENRRGDSGAEQNSRHTEIQRASDASAIGEYADKLRFAGTGSYASIISVSLETEGVDFSRLTPAIIKGKELVGDMKIVGDRLELISLEDPGYDTNVVIRIDHAGKKHDVSLLLVSDRPRGAHEYLSEDEGGNLPAPQKVVLSGLSAEHHLSRKGFSIRADPPIRIKKDYYSLLIYDRYRDKSLEGYTQYIDISEDGMSLGAFGEKAEQLFDALGYGEYSFSMNMAGVGSDFSGDWSFTVIKAQGSLKARFVNFENQDVASESLAGALVAVRGLGHNTTRKVARANDLGRFEVDGLTPGAYEVQLLDLNRTEVVESHFLVHEDSTEVELSIPVIEK